jgi:predicted nucleotidyltransferase
LSSAEVRYLKVNYNEILSKLRKYAKEKAGAHEAKAIILTGSLAKETYTGTSDADILVIADRIPCRVLERYALFAESGMPIDVEPRVYTTKEFISKVHQGDRFALESLKIGIPLHGKQFFEDLRRSLKKKRFHAR